MDTLNTAQPVLRISHESDVFAVRRAGNLLARQLGFNETDCGRLAILITELATNQLKHAREGLLVLTPVQRGDVPTIEVLAIDHGPGIADLRNSLRDGVSTCGTSGNGLGAMQRLADFFDIHTQTGKGSAVYLQLWPQGSTPPPERLRYGAICVPKPGESVCGDAWAIGRQNDGALLYVADGLGHGPEAARASAAAMAVLHGRPLLAPAELLEASHLALRPTRGAAAAALELRFDHDDCIFAGVGNISASIVEGLTRRQLLSHNGIVGHTMRKAHALHYPAGPQALWIMHSDGLGTQWDLNDYPGLTSRHPALIAAVLYRDFRRDRDDATVVVAQRSTH